MRELKLNTTPERQLTFLTPQHFADAAGASGGLPRVYTIVAGQIRLGPAPAASGLIAELLYYARVPALSPGNPANWLLSLYPNIYLFGALSQAGPYLGLDDAAAARWFALYAAGLTGLQGADDRGRHGAAPLVMRPAARTP
jgi:hypothetical protein